MAKTLASFYSDISFEINKGTKFDSRIPTYVRRAVQYLEMTEDWAHMNRFVYGELLHDDETPRTVPLPGRPKSIEFVRIAKTSDLESNEAAKYQEINRIHPRDLESIKKGDPEGYWIDGYDYIIFDKEPKEDLKVELNYIQYTDWPTDTSSTGLWFIDYAEELLICQTIMAMAPMLREPKMLQWYKERRVEWLDAALRANEEFKFTNLDIYMHPDKPTR